MKIENFSDRIKLVMEKRGIKTFVDLAEIGGVSEGSIHNWLRDEEIPRASSRYKVAKAWGVDPEWLRTGEGEMDPPSDERDLVAEQITTFEDNGEAWGDLVWWMVAQPDFKELKELGDNLKVHEIRKARGDAGAERVHRSRLESRIFKLLKDRGQELDQHKIDAVLTAALHEGGWWYNQPSDGQLHRYIDIALA